MGHDLLRRSHFQVLLGVVAATTALAVRPLWPAPATERAAWLADLDRLEAHTAAAYANLGDRLASRKLAPRDLDRQARAALARARTVGEARAALEAFVDAFDDLHFRVRAPYGAPRRWLRRLLGKDRRREAGGIAWTESAEAACARFGVRDRRHGNVDWTSLASFMALADNPVARPFPAGILRQGGQPPVGLVRVGLFGQEGYPELCAAEWDRYRSARATAACDKECQNVFWSGLEETLLDRFAAELAELAAGGATVLLVDLTDNGGGTGIVGRMARMVTARPLPERAFGFIRHPHSVQRFESAAADYTEKLGRADLPERQRELLQAALARIQAAAREAKAPCDLSKMWSLASAAELPCSNVGRSEPWLDSDERAELAALRAAESGASKSRAARGVAWNGKLLVLTNRRTASASEDFVANLQDAGAATIVGERTAGAGCGYTSGGLTLELPATGLTVRAPDCIRYRADGGNEAEGVIPDIPVDWSLDDDARARAAKVVATLQAPRI